MLVVSLHSVSWELFYLILLSPSLCLCCRCLCLPLYLRLHLFVRTSMPLGGASFSISSHIDLVSLCHEIPDGFWQNSAWWHTRVHAPNVILYTIFPVLRKASAGVWILFSVAHHIQISNFDFFVAIISFPGAIIDTFSV